jgi:flagellar biogenesis protein FliO
MSNAKAFDIPGASADQYSPGANRDSGAKRRWPRSGERYRWHEHMRRASELRTSMDWTFSTRSARRRSPLSFIAVALLLAPLLLGVAVGATAPSETTEPRIQFKKSEESIGGLAARVVGGLIVVVIVGIGAVFVLKRYVPSFYHPTYAGAARIKLLEVRRLTPKATLFLVEINGVQLLLGQSADHLSTLYEYPKAARDER